MTEARVQVRDGRRDGRGAPRRVQTIDTLIIGGGQAGLSLSHYLTRNGRPHAVLERGRVGERWCSERWDSLALLTPNWLNRLDGAPPHASAHGFLAKAEFVDYLGGYARAAGSAVREHVDVESVEPCNRNGFAVRTDSGRWRARRVVVATGDAADPFLPRAAERAPVGLRQLHSSRYRNPAQLPRGGVLVVGAGPSGQQIASELRRAGREVYLSVGGHARVPRRYRGRDIWFWIDRLGDLERTIEEMDDPVAAKRAPSFTLTGANGGEQLDLAVLQRIGVTILGRVQGFDHHRALLAPDLRASLADADVRFRRMLARIDDHIDGLLQPWPHDPDRFAEIRIPPPPTELDLVRSGISSVIWATGYRRAYPWLHAPALDDRGEIVHRHGATPVEGLYVLGLKFQRRRGSHFIGRVGADAALLAHGLDATMGGGA
jgi:putative flavoprotein involved in K+ transport